MAQEKITEMTPAQEARLEEYYLKGVAMGLSCEPADWDRADNAIYRAYKLIGEPKPKIYHVGSPKAAQQLAAKLLTPEQLANSGHRGGQFWSPWVAHIQFIRDVLGFQDECLEAFTIDEDLVESCGWVWWADEFAIISDRLATVVTDVQGNLHSLTGPSFTYRDGSSGYHVHGVSVPAEWVTDKQSLAVETALTWPNIEQRRAAAILIGWDKVLDKLQAKEVMTDNYGTLYSVVLNDQDAQFIKVRCGTGRDFVLPVPNNLKTAREAVAWTYDVETYAPEVRT